MKEHPIHKGYFVTEDGRVFSINRGHLKELSRHICRGYKVVSIYINQKQYYKKVHRLVAETYIPNPDNLPMINHIDEDKLNNNVDNLEWCTSQYNVEYSHAKWYKIKTPTGDIVEVFNLSKWCRDSKVDRSWLCKRGSCKGYTLLSS